MHGRVVEVALRTDHRRLEEQVGRSDIGLSMVGVEYQPDERWRGVIHPLALESVHRRAVLLWKPLVNWKHALATLERMRRYAVELGYSVPDEEVAEVWRVFDAQPLDMQRGMLDRLARSAMGGQGLREEAIRRIGSAQGTVSPPDL